MLYLDWNTLEKWAFESLDILRGYKVSLLYMLAE